MNFFTQRSKTKLASSVLALSLCFGATQLRAQFTTGNVVVLQAGDGTTALGSAATPIILKEYTPAGSTGFSVAIPTSTASGNSLVMSGSAGSEGLMTRSADKSILVIPGYYASTGVASIASTTGTVAPRSIGRVDAAGTYSLVASVPSFYSANNIRSATSDGSGNYWGSGANQGTNYFGIVSTPTLVQSTITNCRGIAIYNNQLYFSTGSGSARGIYSVGTGAPTSSTTAAIMIATGSTSSPYQFCLNATGDVCYIADDNTIASGGGIQKWALSGGVWSMAYTYTFTGTNGPRGVIADFSGTNPVIYATTGETALNRLVSVTDGGSVATSTVTTLATAGTNTIFRGVAFSPVSCTPPSISAISAGSAICAGQALNLSVTASGSAPFTYSWTGAGSFSSSSVSSPTVTNGTGSSYSVSVSNGCGTATAAVTATVNALPSITTNSATICSGSSALLNASGANTYTWSTTATTQTISVSPSSTANYTVSGTNGNGCVGTATTSVVVNSLPMLSVNSATNCSGSAAALTVSGANTYTWNTSATGATIVVMPASSTGYTVTGTDLNGCVNTATTSVITSTLPAISVNSATVCAGNSATLTASGANTYTWSNTATTFSITDSPAMTASYTVSGTDGNGCVGSSTASILVNALPSVTSTSATVCSGGTATLTAGGANTYTWSTTANTASIAVSPTSSTDYTVTGTDLNSCISTAVGSVIITASTNISVNSATVCAGTSATLTASGASTYTWSGGENTAGISVTPLSTTVYTVAGQASGCVVTATNTATVTVHALPTVSVTTVSASICANSSTIALSGTPSGGTFSGTGVSGNSFSPSTAGVGTFTISYMVTDANSCSNTSTTPVTVHALPTVSVAAVSASICANSATVALSGTPSGGTFSGTGVSGNSFSPATAGVGTFTVSYMVTDANSCSNTSTTPVTVHALPTVSVAPISGPLCTGSPTVALSGTPSGGIFSGTGVTGNSFSPSTAGAGTFTVSYAYTNASSCSASSSATVMVSNCTGIEEVNKGMSVLVYPNPAKDALHIQFDNAGKASVVEIYDALGNLVYSAETTETDVTVNTAAFGRGLYIIKLKSNASQVSARFIRE